MTGTVLVRHATKPASLVRISVEDYNKAIEDAEELGVECPWIRSDDDDSSQDALSFDQLDEAGQKEVIERQAARAEAKKSG